MAIRAILFDLDGTLIDQFQAIYKAFSQVIAQMGLPVPDFETVKKSVGGASEATMSKLIGEENAKEAVKIWLETKFSGEERHVRRITKIAEITKKIYDI